MSACAHKPPPSSLHIDLTDGLRSPTPRPPLPDFGRLPPPAATGVEERKWLTEHIIKPLAVFSVRQEGVANKEQDRADTLVRIIDDVNRTLAGNAPKP